MQDRAGSASGGFTHMMRDSFAVRTRRGEHLRALTAAGRGWCTRTGPPVSALPRGMGQTAAPAAR